MKTFTAKSHSGTYAKQILVWEKKLESVHTIVTLNIMYSKQIKYTRTIKTWNIWGWY